MLYTILLATFMAGSGAMMLFRTRADLQERQAAHQRRMDDRLARGTDAYADELRSLNAYRPIDSIRQRRIFGAILLALAATLFILTITH